MRIHMREGDNLTIELSGGKEVSIVIVSPEDEGCVPELDIMLPRSWVANCWGPGVTPGKPMAEQPWSVECVQVCIPIEN